MERKAQCLQESERVLCVHHSNVMCTRTGKEYKICTWPIVPNALHSHTGVCKNGSWILLPGEVPFTRNDVLNLHNMQVQKRENLRFTHAHVSQLL